MSTEKMLNLLKLSWNEYEAVLSTLTKEELLHIHEICTREFAIEHQVFSEWLEFKSYLRSELRTYGILFTQLGSAY